MSFMSAASTFSSIAFTVLLSMALSNPVNSQVLNANDWKVTFDTGKFGPVETTLKFTKKNGELIGHSVSGSREIIERLPKASRQKAQIGKYLLSFSLKQNVDKYEGNMIAPWAVGKVSLVFNDNGFKGKIKGGLFSGSFSGVLANLEQTPLRNYPNIIESFIKKVEERVFNPRALKDPVWKKLVGDMKQVGEFAMDDFDVLLGFYFAYEGKPFSHLTFGRAKAPAKQMMEYLDTLRVGGKPAFVEFDRDVAILRVKTMMGVDTIELIDKAYKEIDAKSSKALIIDLRGNGGGAFAIKPLIEHIIDKPFDAGYFITHNWNSKHKRLPARKELFAVAPWQGFSLKAWWENVQTEEIIRLKFNPQKPNFDGVVFVLIDSVSASATEMAIDALSTVKNVTLIGEKTSGEVLSQSPFDTSEGFQAFIPVGDYYSFSNGRIEGIGIKPDVEVKKSDALKIAKKLARKAIAVGK